MYSWQYFDDSGLNNAYLRTVRIDSAVDFAWRAGAPPGTALRGDSGFSVRWTGAVWPLHSETYTFYTSAVGGVRLWVDGRLVIDQRRGEGETERSGSIPLRTGRGYALRMEYYARRAGSASAQLAWASRSQPKEVIPSSQLAAVDLRGQPHDPRDVLDSLPYDGTLEDGLYGWRRSPAGDVLADRYHNYWAAVTSVQTYRKEPPHDLSLTFQQNTGNATVTRDLGAPSDSTRRWTFAADLNYTGNYPNHGTQGGQYFDVLDDAGRIIARFYSVVVAYPNDFRVYGNDNAVVQGTDDRTLRSVTWQWQPLEITAENGAITFRYGPYGPVTTHVFDAASDWRRAKSLRFYFWTNAPSANYSRSVDLDHAQFLRVGR